MKKRSKKLYPFDCAKRPNTCRDPNPLDRFTPFVEPLREVADKGFLLLFFKKEDLAYPSPTTTGGKEAAVSFEGRRPASTAATSAPSSTTLQKINIHNKKIGSPASAPYTLS